MEELKVNQQAPQQIGCAERYANDHEVLQQRHEAQEF